MTRHEPPRMGIDGLGNRYPMTSGVLVIPVAAGDSEKMALASAEMAVRSLYSIDGRCLATDDEGRRCERAAGHDLADGHQTNVAVKRRWGMPPPALSLPEDE